VNGTGEPGESFAASATPEPGSFGTMSFHTVWEYAGPLPEPREEPGRKGPRPLGRLGSLFRNHQDLGPIAATGLLIFGFTSMGIFEFRSRKAATSPPTPTLSERRDIGPPTGLRPRPAEVVLATTTPEVKASAVPPRVLQEEQAAREREDLLQAARKEIPSFGGADMPSVLDAAQREHLKTFVRMTLPREPPAGPGEGGGGEDRSVGRSSSLLASHESMGPR
jgi:hypothetical protein